MKTIKTTLFAVLTSLAVVVGFAAPASADIYGTNVKWATTNIPVKVHASDVGSNRIKTGLNYWTVTNLTPKIGGGSCLDSAGHPQGCVDISDGAHFADATWVAAAERYALADGTIVACTIQFSGDYRWGAGSSLRVQVDDIAAHEFGHCVGHAHTSDATIASIMQPQVKNWNGLQKYDIDQDLILYPNVVAAFQTSVKQQVYKQTFVTKKDGSEVTL